MTRTEKYRDYHNDIRQMIESSLVESVIAQESLLNDKKIIDVTVVNDELISVTTIEGYGNIWEYLLKHDNGVLTKVGWNLMRNSDNWGWYQYGERTN